MANVASNRATGASTPPKFRLGPDNADYSHQSVDIPMFEELSGNLFPQDISIEDFIQRALGFDPSTIEVWKTLTDGLAGLEKVKNARKNFEAAQTGGESQLYKPFINMSQGIVEGFSSLERKDIESDVPLNIKFVECASKPIPSDFGVRKPDIVIAPADGLTYSNGKAQVKSWKQVLVAFEFKKNRAKRGTKRIAEDTSELRSAEKRSRAATEAGINNDDTGGNVASALSIPADSAASSTSQASDIGHISHTKVQLANYIAEMFACESFREWTLGVTVAGPHLTVFYFDRTIAIASKSFSITDNFKDFTLLIIALSACDFSKYGYSKIFRYKNEKDFTELKGSVIKCPEKIDVVDENSGLKEKVDATLSVQEIINEGRYGIFGRATTVRRVKMWKWSGNEKRPLLEEEMKVIKASWQVKRRTSEVEIVEKVNTIDGSHTPKMYLSFDIEAALPSDVLLDLFRETPVYNKFKYEKRLLRFIVFREYFPLYELTGNDYLIAFKQILKCHHDLYEGGVLHRDISIQNLMYHMVKGKPTGILNDYDLSVILGPNKTSPSPSSKHRTGTAPFMAIELLDLKNPVLHLYRHDLESFLYVLVWTAVGYKGFKHSTKDKDPLRSWKGSWDTILDKKTLFLSNYKHYLGVEELYVENYANLRGIIFSFREVIYEALQDADREATRYDKESHGRDQARDSQIPYSKYAGVLDKSITWDAISPLFNLNL